MLSASDDLQPKQFDFELLDEIALLPARHAGYVTSLLRPLQFSSLGPVFEYEFRRRWCTPTLPSLSQLSSSALVRHVAAAFAGDLNASALTSGEALMGLTALPGDLLDPNWTAFTVRVVRAAMGAGFSNSVASSLAGAMVELADNIHRHSEAPKTGAVAFLQSERRFEFVVGDAGIGMLASLKSAPDFRQLLDDLEALQLAVLPGVSRFGRESGCGYGYRTVFAPLRAAAGIVRLRSGKGALTIRDTNHLPNSGVCASRAAQPGVVVSVNLEPNL